MTANWVTVAVAIASDRSGELSVTVAVSSTVFRSAAAAIELVTWDTVMSTGGRVDHHLGQRSLVSRPT